MVELLISYLFGSIPFGLILSNFCGNGKLRSQGSGNIGATNVLRTQGKMLGFATFFLDAVKGAVPLLIFKDVDFQAYIMLAAVCGHMFPVWLKFKGGKGISTFFGSLSTFQPYSFPFAILAWIITFKITRLSSLSGLISVGTSVLMFAAVCLVYEKDTYGIYDFLAFLMTGALIFYRHKDNIKRLMSGEEGKI